MAEWLKTMFLAIKDESMLFSGNVYGDPHDKQNKYEKYCYHMFPSICEVFYKARGARNRELAQW